MKNRSFIQGIGVLILLSLLCLPLSSTATNPALEPSPQMEWQIGEDLIYDVHWSFIYLGSLRFQVLDRLQYRGEPVYHCRLRIDSNPSLPFVKIHDVYESYIGEDFYTRAFFAWEHRNDYTIYTKYELDSENNTLHIRIEKQAPQDTIVVLDSIAAVPGKVLDGLSVLYYARAMVKNAAQIDAPVFAYNKLGKARIHFWGKLRSTKIRGEKIHSFYLDGNLNFIGIAGLKEGFRGWFSRDARSVPLKAYMKAFIGSVRIELKNWKKWDGHTVFAKPENWNSPLEATDADTH